MSLSQIARDLERSQSTITREVNRNKGQRVYRYQQANSKALQLHKDKHKHVKLTTEIIKKIYKYLRREWSPEQIVGRLVSDGIIKLHHEIVYQYILADKKAGGDLYTHLRHQGKSYRKRYGTTGSSSGIPNRRDIDERPEETNNRTRVGDWEADTMIGNKHKGALAPLGERKSKLRLALPVSRKSAEEVTNAITQMLEPIKEVVLSITFDNGREFAAHEVIAGILGCETYFAKPYHSERNQ